MTHKFVSVLLATQLTSTTFAQPPMSMSEADMQKMMSTMEEVQTCFNRIDQKEVETLQQRAKQFKEKLQALCKTGKRQQAQASAKAYYQELMADNTLQQIKACSEKLPESIRSMGKAPIDYSKFDEKVNKHVCD